MKIKCVSTFPNPKVGDKSRDGRRYFIWNKCPRCNKEFWSPQKGNGKMVHCKPCAARGYHERRRAENPSLARCKTSQGYIAVYLNPNSPYYPMRQSHGYILEHRLVIAQHLGRCLKSWEIVHHKNGIKDDNRMENLQLLPQKKYHLVDLYSKARIVQLEARVIQLEAEVTRLNEQIENVVLKDSMDLSFP